MATTSNIARIARAAGEAGKHGDRTYSHNGVTFDLRQGGYCARFVRQVHESVLGLPPMSWAFAAPTARVMENLLRAAGRQVVGSPGPGDIIGINGGSGSYGHIGIYLGGGLFAENTSSSRGPGTTISNVSLVQSRITGYYRAVPAPGDLPLLLVLVPENKAIVCGPKIEDGVARVDLRPVVEALGYEVFDHIADQNKVYLRKRTEPVAPGG